ncbi:MAG TPA: CBS domain-containing protein [Bdellovibrionota bacterium]|nr:CBS domain-containing protein [Bdellovibrionota bacterium]
MKCSDVMSTRIQICQEDDTINLCAERMRDCQIGFCPVVDELQRVVGTVTDRDLAVRAVAERRPWTTKVREVMTPGTIMCRSNAPLRDAEIKMARHRISRIVVVDERESCVGVISLTDLVRVEARDRAGEVAYAVMQREATPQS